MKTRTLILVLLSAIAISLAWPSLVHAGGEDYVPPEPDLSDSETSFVGASMLVGDEDVTLGAVVPGPVGDELDARYAFFVGNTLYAGVEDAAGNTVDLLGEFFWFESSIDRGSDFYVGVFKVRTTPALTDGWRLELDQDPAVFLSAETDLETHTGSFRWDWSIPFENYGWDAYGAVTLETEYGLGLSGEGAVMTAFELDESGVEASAEVQTRGYVSSEYRVRTQYQVTLWRWEILVQGSAGSIDWGLVLNSGDRDDQNAYHEFFLVMQTEQDMPFEIDSLQFGGSVREPVTFWPDNHVQLGALVQNIVLLRPEPPVDDPGPGPDSADDDDDDSAEDVGEEADDGWADGPMGDLGSEMAVTERTSVTSSCTVAAASARSVPAMLLGALALLSAKRRRD